MGRRATNLPKLKCCPRCGSLAVMGVNPARVYCSIRPCGFKGPKKMKQIEAAEAWNKIPDLRKMVDLVQAIVDTACELEDWDYSKDPGALLEKMSAAVAAYRQRLCEVAKRRGPGGADRGNGSEVL